MDLDNSTVKYVKHDAVPAMGIPEITTIKVIQGDLTWSVPMVNDNSQYQDILAWAEEGNTIEEADE